MVQWLATLAALIENLGSVSSTDVAAYSSLQYQMTPCLLLSSMCARTHMVYIHTEEAYIHTHNEWINIFKEYWKKP